MFIINRDGTNLTILDAGVGGNYDPNWSPDGTKIAFTKVVSSFTQIYQMDLVSGTVSALVDSELSTSQPVWSPDGTKIAYIQSKYDAEHIWILDIATKNNWQLTKTKNQDDSQPAWSSDGNTIFFTRSSIADYNPSLAAITVDPNGSSLEYPIPLANHPVPLPAGDADLSHDGQWMVFESWPDGKNHDIYLMNITGEVVSRLTEASKVDFQAVWNPVSMP